MDEEDLDCYNFHHKSKSIEHENEIFNQTQTVSSYVVVVGGRHALQ